MAKKKKGKKVKAKANGGVHQMPGGMMMGDKQMKGMMGKTGFNKMAMK